MPEVTVNDPGELSILGLLLKYWIDRNLRQPEKSKYVEKIKGIMVVKVGEMAVTLHFKNHEIRIENGTADRPNIYIEGPMSAFLNIGIGRVNPIVALIRRQVKFRGSILRLLKIRRLILPEELQ